MIEKIYSLSKKSFKNYSGPDFKFKRINIVFGYNGRGKSSLAEGIIDEFLKNNVNENCRFFNKSFIRKNISLEETTDNQLIKGVKANFGKKDIDIEKKITDFEHKIIDTTELKKQVDNKFKQITDSFEDVFQKKKGNVSIRTRSKGTDINEILNGYVADYNNAKKLESNDDNLVTIIGDDSFEKEYTRTNNTEIPNIELLNEQDITEIYNISIEEYSKEEIPNFKTVNWINEGVEIHKNKTKCEFCGGSVSIADIDKKLNIYKSNRKQIASNLLNS